MNTSIQSLYAELESLDLDLILSAETGDVANVSQSLQLRQKCLNSLVANLSSGNVLMSERDDLQERQNRAKARHERIVEVYAKLRDQAKSQLLQTGLRGGFNNSPYARKIQPRRIKT